MTLELFATRAFGIIVMYGPYLALILYAIYQFYKRRHQPHFWMRAFTILIAFFPLMPLAILGLGMSIGMMGEMLSKGESLVSLFPIAYFFGGPAGLVGLIYVLLGHKTRFELVMMSYGFVSYCGLLLTFLIGGIRENTHIQWYQEFLDGTITSIKLFYMLLLGLYLLFSVWVFFFNIKDVYKTLKEKTAC